jgi:hypothetical protein
MNRRNFLKLIGIGGAAKLAPAALFAESEIDVRGWRFGVWELQYNISPRNYWARCDCGAERAVGMDKLLSMDALSCDHVRHRGFFSISPDAVICQNCGERRRFFFNGDGFRIWRCGNCEEADIRAYLRREYGDTSSIQFTANMRKTNVREQLLITCRRDGYYWNRRNGANRARTMSGAGSRGQTSWVVRADNKPCKAKSQSPESRSSLIICLSSATAAASISPGLFTNGLSLSQRFR